MYFIHNGKARGLRGVQLPLHNYKNLTFEDVDYICDNLIKNILKIK